MANPTNKQFTIHNYGNCAVDISNYMICSGLIYESIGNMNVIGGSTTIPAGGDFTLEWPAWVPEPSGTDLAIYLPGADFTNPDDMLDFVQWGTAGNGQESVADAKGIWTAGTFVTGFAPYNYTGNGSQDGVLFWQGSAAPCSIDGALPLSQTACEPADNAYTQQIAVFYSSGPAVGTLDINGQSFPVQPSPMVVTLIGLDSDGNSVDVNVSFSADPACSETYPGLFIAPAACDGPCESDLNGDGLSDIADLLEFLADFGCVGTCLGDLNNDGMTDSADILLFLPGYGQPCP
ncbi:MAG: hypothetical protein HKN32_04845 [Flavobacteriales bacterium]|nr:hypothetical protein [Flavobacteriales bacterium]